MRNVLLLLALCVPASADQYGGFQDNADSGSLKPFARDLGGIIGAATFHGGRSLGFSGFDVGGRGGMQFRPAKGDRILRNGGVKAFGLPWVQAEVGMPFRIDGFIRAVGFQGLSIAGGGLRYGLLNSSDAPWAPQLLISGTAHSVVHQHFSASHFGANLVGSMGTPMVTPYLGVGVDKVNLKVRSSLVDPTLNGSDVTTTEPRYTLGIRLKPWQFFYISLAGIYVHQQAGAEAGMGVRF